MPKLHKFTKAQQAEVEEQIAKTTNARLYRKLQVLQLRIKGYTNSQIGEITGYSDSRVRSLIYSYIKRGISYFEQENRCHGNRRNLSFSEESSLLSDFLNQAEKGQIITVGEIKQKYESACGHTIGSGTIYKVLARHGWRKVMPRSVHPKKASAEAVEASKKLTPSVENF